MKKYIPYFSYFIFWILYFQVARAVFLLYHLSLTTSLSSGTIANCFLYGLRMDASFAAYICILPFLLYLARTLFPNFRAFKLIRIYTIVLIVVISFLTVADLELYSSWGFRMDATPLLYFKNPREMAATVSSSPVLILLLIWFLLCFISIYGLKYFHLHLIRRNADRKFVTILFSVLLVGVLFIPIRGGVQKIALNISDAYFSDQMFANHATINLPWNIMFSLLNRNSVKNPFDYFSNTQEADRLVASLYDTGSPRVRRVVDTTRPNLIFIILESFTAKWVGALGGVPGVTPNLDSIASDGLLFTNIYAAGDRSEKGQVAVLSGYPNQAVNSIIKMPTKTRSLPSLAKTLKSFGYTSSYTYGGELEFANIKSYLINAGYPLDRLLSKYSFPISERTTSWGVHDQYVFERFLADLNKDSAPFFSTIFSLSSHEPFDVPLKHFKGVHTETDLFKNSVFYTDSVLGDFMRKLRKEPIWKNSLVVIVADHGQPMPGNDLNDAPSKFHIPLVFSGGALTAKGRVAIYGSQTDIIPTVLGQMDIPSEEFKWGKNLLDSSAKSFAFYNFNNGFGWMTPNGFVTMDNVSQKIIRQSPGFDTSQLKYGKAYMQVSYQDYLDK